MKQVALPLLLSLAVMDVPQGHAQSVYEGFADYANAVEVLSQNGGTGFLDNWQPRSTLLGSGGGLPSPASIRLLPLSMPYIDSQGNLLLVSGGSLFITGANGNVALARSFDVSALPNNGPDPQTGLDTYISFLMQRGGSPANPDDPVYGGSYPWGDNLYPRAAGLNLFSSDAGDAVPLFIGGVSNSMEDVWRLRGQDLDGVSKDPLIAEPFGAGNRVYLVVIRIDHGQGDGGADEVNMYLNPLLAAEELNTIGVTADWETRDDPLYLPGHWLGIEAGDASSNRPFADLSFDEFRIGQTWADVVPHVQVNPCGFPQSGGHLDTGDWLGWIYALQAPWYFSLRLDEWVYIPDLASACGDGDWVYVANPPI